jgi:hypothetical protein
VETVNTAARVYIRRKFTAVSPTSAAGSFFSRKSHLVLLLMGLSAAFSLAGDAVPESQPERPTEFQVKAAYVYNFGKFVRWPAKSPSNVNSFDICVLGKDPFGRVLDATVSGETIDGKKVSVNRVSRDQISHCRVLFVGDSEQNRLVAILAAARTSGVLTVSDMPRFAERGGMIGFVNQQDRIRFEVNRTAVEGAGLMLSSELLKVATRVIGNGPRGI